MPDMAMSSTLEQPRDWKAQIRKDADFVHNTVLRVHPGSFDTQNPHFRAQLATAHQELIQRAEVADSFWHYNWAMNAFIASFNDVHVSLTYSVARPKVQKTDWPGFLTQDVRGEQVVRVRQPGQADGPEIGDVLVGCDGVPAKALLFDRVGRFFGRWTLESQRLKHSYRLFLDATNPYISRQRACIFLRDGVEKEYKLNWIPLSDENFNSFFRQLTSRYSSEFAYERKDQSLRVAFKNFDPTPGKQADKTIGNYVGLLAADLRGADAPKILVLDLRGNGGGSSHYSRLVAESIWGQAALTALPSRDSYVEWRPSDEKIAIMDKYMLLAGLAGLDASTRQYWKTVLEGLKQARKEGVDLWREPKRIPMQTKSADEAAQLASLTPFAGKVFVLTDGHCASACLNAVDLWTALGAVQVGRETDADTLYMDLVEIRVPGFPAEVNLPTKVFRNRARGSNVPHTPAHIYSGDLADTPSVMSWISTLTE